MLQCDTVCCSLLHCILQRVAVWCSAPQCVVAFFSELRNSVLRVCSVVQWDVAKRAAVCCSALQRAAVYRSVLQRGAVSCSVSSCDEVCYTV